MLQGWRIFRGPAVVRVQLEFQVSKRQRGMKGLLGLKGAVSRKSLMLKTGGQQECLNSNDPEYVTQECIWLRKDGVSQDKPQRSSVSTTAITLVQGYAQCRRDLLNRLRTQTLGAADFEIVAQPAREAFKTSPRADRQRIWQRGNRSA